MAERRVTDGLVGCPACQREYPIVNGVVRFGTRPAVPPVPALPNPVDIIALLGITTPGGCAVFIGSGTEAARAFQEMVDGVHCIAVNAEAPGCSSLESASAIPLRDAMARGVVLGGEYAGWAAEAVRILLPGLRIVTLGGKAPIAGLGDVVQGEGMMVGRKVT